MIARLAAMLLVACATGLQAQDIPAVSALEPAHGAMEVDPRKTRLTVSFDRDMNTGVGWSVCGGGPTFPRIEGISWRDARTLVLRVRLQPATRYEMPLNCEASSQRFQDGKGNRLPPTAWSFTTGDDRLANATQRERNEASLDAVRGLLDTSYSYRDRVVADWDRLFEEKRDLILAAGSDASFALRIAALLGAAEDPHLWFGPLGQHVPTFVVRRPANYDLRVLERLVPDLEKLNDTIWCGTIADGERRVGYLLVGSLSNSIQGDIPAAQDVLDELASSCEAMVLDLRPNGGGNEILAMPIAAWFVRGTKVYAGHVRKNPKTGAWDLRSERKIIGRGKGRRFDGPVAVLIGPHCVSSCEAFVLMMRQAERAVLVGANTRGSSGNPQAHELPNGITVWLPPWRAVDADGKPIEGVGIAPDVEVATVPRDFRGRDPVLEKALEVLRER